MARAFEIIDGEGVLPTLSFIDGGTFAMDENGEAGSSVALTDLGAGNVVAGQTGSEMWTFHSLGASVDNLAYRQRALHALLLKAAQYELTPWQGYPVYLKVQHDGETSPRYAILRGHESLTLNGVLNYDFSKRFQIQKETLTLVREKPWRSIAPTASPSGVTLTKTSGSADKDLVWVLGANNSKAVTHIYNYDSSLTAWSANLAGGNSITPWSVSGATPAAGDIMYIGNNSLPFLNFILPILTAGAYSADVVVEAYISAAWTALTLGTNYLIWPAKDPDDLFKYTGENAILFRPGSNWQATTINGINAYWVRLRLNAVTTWTTTPVSHGTETPYTQGKAYFTVGSSVIGGDAHPKMRLRFYAMNGGAITTPLLGAFSRLIIGAKSKNLATFEDTLYLHNYGLPSGWARTLGTDASETAANAADEGYLTDVSFGTNINMVERCQLYGTNKLSGFRGTYRVLAHVYQTGGAAGGTAVKAQFLVGVGGSLLSPAPVYETPTVALKGFDLSTYEVVDLGEVTLPFARPVQDDAVGEDLVIKFFAQRVAGSPTIRLSCIRLIPTDEWYMQLDDPTTDITNGGTAMRTDCMLEVDLGTRGERTLKMVNAGATPYVGNTWLRSAGSGRIMPGTTYRFYMAILSWPSLGWGTAPLGHLGRMIGVRMAKVNTYVGLRGDGS